MSLLVFNTLVVPRILGRVDMAQAT